MRVSLAACYDDAPPLAAGICNHRERHCRFGLRGNDGSAETDAVALLPQAIRNQLCVRASYNRGMVIPAPHILYTCHDAPFVDAVVIERNGGAPVEAKLASFGVAGLKSIAMTVEAFVPFAGLDLSDPRYAQPIITQLEPRRV
ncbi:hypothetical protein GCM10009087_19100 [Sphingomonas oligophenolica]|uniref:Uncharacterized protein n=1 Tax=Sphingomonas oligophenolica TaxID=301154 RepID=A0ABU9Y341_9SPHN